MNLISQNFQNGEELPVKYSCDGERIAPSLAWSNFPTETKSFALILEDPDAVGGKTFTHWLVINIPVAITSVAEGSVDIPQAEAITNDGGSASFFPPCPPPGTGAHRYIFKIYALDVEKLEDVNKDNFYEKIKNHVLDKAELLGKYKRQ